MSLFLNPVFVGGVLPMIFFGLMDFSFRLFAGQKPFHNVFFYTALGGLITFSILSFTIFGVDTSSFLSLITYKSVAVGVGLGLIWAIAISAIGTAYEKMNANSSQVVPIASSSGLFTAFLGVFFLGEQTSFWILALSAVCILLGVTIVSQAELNTSAGKSSTLALLVGGGVPLLGFGVLNTLFKIWSDLNPGIIGMIMSVTGIFIALCIQHVRKTPFTHDLSLLITGVFWALAVGSLGYGFWPLQGDASVLLPVATNSIFITILLAAFVLKEKVRWGVIAMGAVCIVTGVSILNILG